jgi:hypothetical protein
MSDLTIGFILLALGMSGTLASLGLVSLLIALLKRLFPYVTEAAEGPK